mmetsp:Transcript_33859/g.52186  ORF Transcript_33859/g.52186 Transcript_33859/m.52186 type:complete len:207 (+) Transcript_33859:731-1351(+)
MVLSGRGENILSLRPHELLLLKNLDLTSQLNSVYIENGMNLVAEDIVLEGNYDIDAPPLSEKERHEYAYAGGIHLKNMDRIDLFRNITLKGLQSNVGGGMFVELDTNLRVLNYNEEAYVFEELTIENCNAFEGGGGLHVDSIRNLKITGNSVIKASRADNGTGGGIDFKCSDDDVDCRLELEEVEITENFANEGGGIKWHDVEPIF